MTMLQNEDSRQGSAVRGGVHGLAMPGCAVHADAGMQTVREPERIFIAHKMVVISIYLAIPTRLAIPKCLVISKCFVIPSDARNLLFGFIPSQDNPVVAQDFNILAGS